MNGIGKTINHFGLSSGKDSTALFGWAINESGYPPESCRFSFCDTQNEYQEVYDQIAFLSDYAVKRGYHPVRTLHSEGFLALAIRKKRFPSAKARFCTQVLKIFPTLYYFQELQLDGYDILSHSGVRADESTERSMLEEYSERHGILERRPLLKWTIDDIWKAHKRYKLPINPLYFMGRKRVGCKLCCMSSKQDVRITAKHRPWVIDQYAEWETMVGDKDADGRSTFSGFFRATTVPKAFRSRKWKNKKGELFQVCTIRDVVRWSKTLRGGKQEGFAFMYEEDDAHLPCQSGYCE